MAYINYPVGDYLIRFKNAVRAGLGEFEVSSTKLVKEVAKAMKREGLALDIKEEKGLLVTKIAYRKKQPILMDIKLISKPGLRIYKGVDDISSKKGASIYILTTPAGVLSSKEALKKGVGGEVIAEIY